MSSEWPMQNIQERKVETVNDSSVIKNKSLESLKDDYYKKLDGEFEAEQLLEIAKELFEELKVKYGIETPVEFSINEGNDGEQVLYTKVDKIDGQDLLKRENLEDIGASVQTLYINLSKYFLNKLNSGEFFLTDINSPSQYVYGKKLSGSNGESQIYLVDADIYLDNRQKSLLTVVYWFSRHLSGIEHKLGTQISQSRDNIEKFIEKYQELFPTLNSKDQKRLTEIRNFLSGNGFGDEILPAIPTSE